MAPLSPDEVVYVGAGGNASLQMYRDKGEQKAVRALVAARYWPLVREQVEGAPAIDIAVRTGVNTWWEPGNGSAQRVVAKRVNIPMLSRVRWNACTVRFQ